MPGSFITKEYRSVTALAHQTVLRAPNGLDAKSIAELVNKPYQTFMSEVSRQQGHKLGADMLLPIMDATGSDAIVEFLARERGGIFIRTPAPAAHNGDLINNLAGSIKDFAEYAKDAAEGFADGLVEAHELASLERRADEAMATILKVKMAARATHEKQFGSSVEANK